MVHIGRFNPLGVEGYPRIELRSRFRGVGKSINEGSGRSRDGPCGQGGGYGE